MNSAPAQPSRTKVEASARSASSMRFAPKRMATRDEPPMQMSSAKAIVMSIGGNDTVIAASPAGPT